MAMLIAIELFTLWFAINTLSSVRALVGAEGLYSKAQKDGIYTLTRYSLTHDEEDYNRYLEFMSVPLGDHKTRLELEKQNPDYAVARQGFLEGRIHSDDIDGMISLLRRFHNITYIKRAISLWTRGDSLIADLLPIADSIHQLIRSKNFRDPALIQLTKKIDPLNRELTTLEDEFSFTLGEGSRWLENIILKLLFAVALTVEITGLIITISVSRNITKGLNEIIRATRKIALGKLDEKATVFSGDEIGQVADAVNKMTDRLVRSNNELSQFANVASHDLQEPLRTITSYISMYQDQYGASLDETEKKYLDAIIRSTGRMQLLIKGILDYSLIGSDKTKSSIDLNQLIKSVLEDMEFTIRDSGVLVTVSELPTLVAYQEIRVVFQNLLSNAVKFRKADGVCTIRISASPGYKEWIFSIADNGIGIDQMYHQQIFTIFQKLHPRSRFEGAGIGLAHCTKIIELHGGRMWVDSEPGKGSTFYFTVTDNV